MTTSGAKISKRVEKELHQNKVIIRRLPPDITEEKFRESIDPFPDHAYFYLAPGDHTLGPLGCSRAYIAFEREDDIVPFRDQYDGMILESEKGGKYRAIVEFAPYQGIPKKRKQDHRCGTIDKDSDFLSFMQSLENQPEPRPSISLETYLEELEANRIQDVQVTPLIEYLRDKRSGRSRGRVDTKKKRKGGESSSSKSKRSSKSADSAGSKSRESSSSKGKKEKKESERTGSSTKLAASSTQEGGGESSSRSGSSTKVAAASSTQEAGRGGESSNRSGSSHRSASGGAEGSRQEKKGKYRGGSDRREGGQEGDDTSGDKESRKGRQKNRDRPDRSIYVPRSRDQGGGGGAEREGKERDSSRDYPSRGGRGRQGRRDDSGEYGGRPRSRGRGRGYRSSRGSDQHYESGYQDK